MAGDYPRLCVRIPAEVLEGLKKLSRDRSSTPSKVVRTLVVEELARSGYDTDPKKKEEDAVV